MGGNLAAINRQQRRAAGRIVLQNIFAGGSLGFARTVVIERADAGISPDHVIGPDRLGQIFADGSAEIFDLLAGRLYLGGIAFIVPVGGADQREIVLIGNVEDNPAIAVLEHVGAGMRIQL